MDLVHEIESCCFHLQSNKVTDRRKFCTKLSYCFENIGTADNNDLISWRKILHAVQECMRKDAEKTLEDLKRKANSAIPELPASDLFKQLVINALKQPGDTIDVKDVVGYIIGCMKDTKMRKCYGTCFLSVLWEQILSSPKCRGKLEESEWEDVYIFLKEMCLELEQNHPIRRLAYDCFGAVIKWGPASGLPISLLKKESKCMKRLCLKVHEDSLQHDQTIILNIAIDFCKHIAMDARSACCDIGEELVLHFANFYVCNNRAIKQIKELIIEFYLLQIVIHHPNGTDKGDYAHNQDVWQKCLKRIYTIVTEEIELYFKTSQKNTSFFLNRDGFMYVNNDFLLLFIEVSRQIFKCQDSYFVASTSGETSCKRQKYDISLKSYITNVTESSSWLWIHIMCNFIELYPELLDKEDYVTLLKSLSIIQVKSTDNDVLKNVYDCLLKTLEHSDFVIPEVHELWKTIGETTIKALGQNVLQEFVEGLLQKMIECRMVDLNTILPTYESGLLKISLQSVNLLRTGVQHLNFSQIDNPKRVKIMNCVMNYANIRDCHYLVNEETAMFLIILTLKSLPDFHKERNLKRTCEKYQTIREIYYKSSLEKGIILSDECQEKFITSKIYEVKLEMRELLFNTIQHFINNIRETHEKFSIVVLLINMLNVSLIYGIISEDDIEEHALWNLINSILQNNTTVLDSYKCKDKRDSEKLLNCINILQILFTLKVNDVLMDKLKHDFPQSILKIMVGIFKTVDTDSSFNPDWYSKIRESVLKTLTAFGCICGTSLNKTQYDMLSLLFEDKYDLNSEKNCTKLLTFLDVLKDSKPGTLPDLMLDNILAHLHNVCFQCYQYNETAIKILDILYAFYPIFFATDTEKYKVDVVTSLQIFYQLRSKYGSSVSLCVLRNVTRFYEVDPDYNYAKWEDIELIEFVTDFLNSDYQEVRLNCIENLVFFFKRSYKCKTLESFNRQKKVLQKMYKKSVSLLDEVNKSSEDTNNDELNLRVSTVIHTFTSIIINCDDWIEESFIYLVTLAYQKNLSLNKAFNIINSHFLNVLNVNNMVEKYVKCIVENWIKNNINFDNFPFHIFNCENKIQFYKKYWSTCAPFFVMNNTETVLNASSSLGFSLTELIENVLPKVFGRVLCENHHNLTPDFLTSNKFLVSFIDLSSADNVKLILRNKLDQVVLTVLQFLLDHEYIRNVFEENVIFNDRQLSSNDIKSCFYFIEVSLCGNEKLTTFLSKNHLPLLETILLELKFAIYDVLTAKDTLKMLHRYTFFIDMILENTLNDEKYFFIRDTIYFFINFIENRKKLETVPIAALRYFTTFLKKIINDYLIVFEGFMNICVNAFKSFMNYSEAMHAICMDIMTFLIVDNSCKFMSAIEKLDNFPIHPDFTKIRTVHHRIKYGNSDAKLENEINYFLNCNDSSARQDNLIHLRNILADNKIELKRIYDKFEDTRSFSKDCNKSLIHRLISNLAELSCSSNQDISFEAMKCLGEIGPANLTTLLLRSEKEILDLNCSPFELLCGSVISLLINYTADPNIDVVKHASEAMYFAVNCKEAKNVIGSNLDFGNGPIKKEFIIPFLLQNKTPRQSTVVDIKHFSKELNSLELCPSVNLSHEKWITLVTVTILKMFKSSSYLVKLIPVCELRPQFAESIFSLIIYLLFNSSERLANILSLKIEQFFNIHWNCTIEKSSEQNLIAINKKSIKCMLDLVGFLRMQISSNASKSSRNQSELKLNYLKVGKASQFCKSHFSALFYSELWCQSKIEKIQNENTQLCEQRSNLIDNIYESESEEVGVALHGILKSAYKAIGDLDALSGCGITFLIKPEFRVEHYKEQNRWDQVMHFYDLQLSINPNANSKNLFDSFTKCGLYQVPLLAQYCDESQYDCLWRLGQWDFQENQKAESQNLQNFEKFRFYSLKAVHENNPYLLEEAKKSQMLCIYENLRHTSFENCESLYPILSQLQCMVEVEDFFGSISKDNFKTILIKWKQQDNLLKRTNFEYIEPVMTQRQVMLTDFLKTRENDVLKTYLIDFALDFTCLAKDEERVRNGFRILENLKILPNLNSNDSIRIQLMEAQLSWLAKNELVTKHILNNINNKSDIDIKLKSAALKLLGRYTSEIFSENQLSIIQNYYLPSLTAMNNVERTEEDKLSILDTFNELAQFADKQYQQTMNYMKSDLFQKKVSNMEKIKETAINMQKRKSRTIDERKAATIHTKNSIIDEIEINTAREECNQFLELALKYYLLNLSCSDFHNIAIFRIMALFLENRNNPVITKTINTHLPKISSYKYITILPQLIPHINDSNNDLFTEKVTGIIEKCAVDHPHHTLPLLLSLIYADKDREYDQQKTNVTQNDARTFAAVNMLKKLKKVDKLSKHITELEELFVALIELAYYKPNESKNEYNIPRNQKITKIKNFENVLLPTYSVEVKPTCNYTITGISSFYSTYHSVGGINAPKKIYCRCTNGSVRTLLVKGNDDLRQDAVMQQVFTIMNSLLRKNKDTKNLLIRTYKIVPLSKRSGVLEWVEKSIPIGNYLVGEGKNIGAHEKYRPGDKSPSYCRDTFKRCASLPAEGKLKTYKQICKYFKPVFHKFFETSFPQPNVWYERRRAYIHSVATSSMCGYILGIGDRHVSNILIDTDTAEVIHIDFGIAFEQGRTLQTPETVPFRLTRDIVDGMGVSGVDGIFRKSCEKTIKVLRQNAQTIITILEVLLYDPLYAWTVSAAEANKRQTDDEILSRDDSTHSPEEDTSVNVTAERALLRLREKLQGTEQGHVVSIELQVGTLIQQAIDPVNLCKLFVGWQPYL